jgi:hypothetical protein
MEQEKHCYFASWMLVPAILVVPAVISGLSIWNNWGPHWFMSSIAVAAALLALIIDHEHALRYALIGAGLGLITSPILLLFSKPDLGLFGWWVTAAALTVAFVVPLMWKSSSPPQQQSSPEPLPADTEHTLERLLPTVSQQREL